jgi:hypothetical protein
MTLTARIWAYVVLVGVALAALLRAVGFIRQSERDKISVDNAASDAATNKRLDNADVSSGDTNADLEWLRARAKK